MPGTAIANRGVDGTTRFSLLPTIMGRPWARLDGVCSDKGWIGGTSDFRSFLRVLRVFLYQSNKELGLMHVSRRVCGLLVDFKKTVHVVLRSPARSSLYAFGTPLSS